MLTKILIADSCEESCMALVAGLKDRYWVRTCPEGSQALELLDEFCPDVLIVDLVLRGVDGLRVIQAARKRSDSIVIMVTSSIHPSYAANQLNALRLDYIGLKPCSTDYLLERIEELAGSAAIPLLPTDSPQSVATVALLEMGMVPGRAGFLYIRDAIVMLSENLDLRVTKNVYPEIAGTYNTSPTAVEKDIRDLIAATWQDTDPALLRRYFLPAPNGRIPRPTNKAFLYNMAHRLFFVQRQAK